MALAVAAAAATGCSLQAQWDNGGDSGDHGEILLGDWV